MLWALKLALSRLFQIFLAIHMRILPFLKAHIIDGSGAIARIPALLKDSGIKKPLVLTDKNLLARNISTRVLDLLSEANIPYSLCDSTQSNPTIGKIEAAYKQYLSEGCDALIAVGGGSVIDTGKALGARVARPEKSLHKMGGFGKVKKPLPFLMAVPTTAGSGSDASNAALITDEATNHKYRLLDRRLVPRYAVLDPELTRTMPRHITAATGADALTNAVEAYLRWGFLPKEARLAAEEAVALIFRNIELAYEDGQNMHARHNMMRAAHLAGYAYARAAIGNSHSISHTLSGLYGIPNSIANAVLLPIVLDEYGKRAHKRLARLCRVAGVARTGATVAQNANFYIREIRALLERLGMPAGFNCIRDRDIPTIIGWAQSASTFLRPVLIMFDYARYRSVLEASRDLYPAYAILGNCTGCGICVSFCPVNAIYGDLHERHFINKQRCVRCGTCARVCQHRALRDENGFIPLPLQPSFWKEPEIDRALCSACGICVNACAPGALEISMPQTPGDIAVYARLKDRSLCVSCGLCARACPVGAIEMVSKKELL